MSNSTDNEWNFRIRSRYATAAAVKNGLLVRPSVCSKCGGEPSLEVGKDGKPFRGIIHAHHTDYTKPLEVEWLCRSCHVKCHPKQKGDTLHKRRNREMQRRNYPRLFPVELA